MTPEEGSAIQPKYIVYDDHEIAVGLFAADEEADAKHLLHLGMRWLPPRTGTTIMGGETQWFLLPHSFGVAAGRTLIEQKVADCGLAEYFDERGFKRMVAWLIEMQELTDAMCY